MNGKFTRYAKLLENNVEPDLCVDRRRERSIVQRGRPVLAMELRN